MKKFVPRSKVAMGAVMVAVIMGAGCGDSESFVFTNPGPGINAPIAVNDAFNALGNATVNRTAPNGVLTNDTLNGAQIIGFDAQGSNGGALTLNADGSLAYTPAFGFVGLETFNYTIANQAGESTATITFTSSASGRFVDNTAPADGNGSQAQPFDTLAEAVVAAQPGDTIFVARGDGTSNGMTGAINLPDGVDLIGEGTGLVAAQTIVPAGPAPVVTGPILCGGNNTISGLTIRGSAEVAIEAEDVGDILITNNTIGGSVEDNIFLIDITGTVTISNNLFDDPPDAFSNIFAQNFDTNGTLVVNDNTFTNQNNRDSEALLELLALSTSVMNVTVSGNVANGTQPEQFGNGFDLSAFDNAVINVTISDNTINNFEQAGIQLDGDTPDATVNATVTGNTVSNINTGVGIFLISSENDTVTVSGNIVSNTEGPNLFLVYEGGGNCIVENNQLSDSPNDGVYLVGGNDNAEESKIAVRNNTIDSTPHSIHLEWEGDGNLCADITGNNVTADIVLDGTGASGSLDVEQLSLLDTLNTLNGNSVDATDVNEVADGACMIP